MINVKKEKAFHSWRSARFHLNFPNGNQVSTVWGSGTYTDNYYDPGDFKDLDDKRQPIFDSETVEIMFSCSDKLKKKILKKYNDGNHDPIGHLSLQKWLQIVNMVEKEKKQKKKQKKKK